MTANTEEALVDRIRKAFAGVMLEDGISLIETEYADAGQVAPPHLVRKQERSDWTALVNDQLCDFLVTFCFTDYKGFRFYIPAYMIWTLQNFRGSDSMILDGTIYGIDPSSHVFEIHRFEEVFTDQQLDCMRDFLTFAKQQGNHFDVTAAEKNLQQLNRVRGSSLGGI